MPQSVRTVSPVGSFGHVPPGGGGGGVDTVMEDVALFPPLVAVMVAVPAATPVTKPLAETVATAPALDDHVTVRPVSVPPAESFSVAASWTVWPACMVAVG